MNENRIKVATELRVADYASMLHIIAHHDKHLFAKITANTVVIEATGPDCGTLREENIKLQELEQTIERSAGK